MNEHDEKEERFCIYCEKSSPAPEDDTGDDFVICKRRGLVRADGFCRAFKYDILRREPKERQSLPKIDKIDI